MIRCKDLYLFLITALLLSACVVKDDIPLPIVDGSITAFEVDGQCDESDNSYAEAKIDDKKRTVDVYVGDTVNISSLTIKRFEVSNNARILPAEGVCVNPARFPSVSFWRTTGDTSSKVNFSNGSAQFTLRTYQDYEWKVNVKQVIIREVQIDGQVGDAVIDPVNRNVLINVDTTTHKLSSIVVKKFSLGGKHGTVTPDPTASATFDFSQAYTPFQVKTKVSDQVQTWRVFVYHTDAVETVEATSFVRSTSITISGSIPNGTTPIVEYHAQNTQEWTTVNPNQVTAKGSRFTADITGLRPSTTYIYRITSGSAVSSEYTIETVGEEQLKNAGFEEWSSIKAANGNDLLQPWGEGEKDPYWGTGNKGATIASTSNSTYVDEEGRRFANLESVFIAAKLAAGNIFTGEYLETDGTNGVLSFGRSFTAFPTKMCFEYRYRTSIINRVPALGWDDAYGNYISKSIFDNLKGQKDSCNVYIALGDWEPGTYTNKDGVSYPYIYLIRTRTSALHLMNMKDPHLIAFAQMTKGEDVNTWTTETLPIEYIVKNRRPKYIIVVASSSKYGDYFTGGEGSRLQLDNIELIYD